MALDDVNDIWMRNYENTGYCGKGLLDNLHEHCKGEWPQYWECYDEEDTLKHATFILPKITIHK